MYKYVRNIVVWAVIVGVVVYVFLPLYRQPHPREELAYSQFLTRVEEGQVARVTVSHDRIVGTLTTGDQFLTHGPMSESLLGQLRTKNAVVEFAPEPRLPSLIYVVGVGAFLIGVVVGVVFRRERPPGKA